MNQQRWPTVADLVDRGPWYRNKGIILVNMSIALALMTSYTNGFDGSMTNGLQILDQWEEYFGNPTGSTLGVLTSVQNIGGFIALPVAPFLTDGLGRRKAIFIGGIIMLAGVAVQAQAQNVVQFIIARGLIGFGMTFSINSAPLLVTELAYPTQRGSITAMYNTTWYLGSIVSAWATFGTFRISGSTWAWRIPSILQALPSVLQCTLICFCPESPRWLVSKGQDEEAKRVLGKYHGNGDIYHPLVDYEYNEIREAISLESEMGKVSYWTLFSTPGNRRRMRIIIGLGIFSQWSGNGLVSYYINIILETVGIQAAGTKTLINGILQIFNFGMAVTASMFVEKIGRRKLFLASNFGMLVVFVGWTVTSAVFQETGSKIAANFTIVMIFLYYGFYDIAYTPLLVAYAVEILPFAIRAKGFALMSFIISLTLIFNQYVNPVALERLGWKYYLFYVCWLAFEAVFIFMYLWETKGRTLEQTAVLFDGEPESEEKGIFVEEFGLTKLRDAEKRRRQSRKLDSPPMAASGIYEHELTPVSPAMIHRDRTETVGPTKSFEYYQMKSQYEWDGGYTTLARDVKF